MKKNSRTAQIVMGLAEAKGFRHTGDKCTKETVRDARRGIRNGLRAGKNQYGENPVLNTRPKPQPLPAEAQEFEILED